MGTPATKKGQVSLPSRVSTPKETILQAASIFFKPCDAVEVRIPKAGREKTISGYFTDPEILAKQVMARDGKVPGTYWTLNPVNPALFSRAANRLKPHAVSTTTDADVLRRAWFLVDLDPKRPGDISSSAEELRETEAFGDELSAALTRDFGFPEPVIVMSGNGIHLFYHVDMPNDEETTGLFRDALKGIAERFPHPVAHVDLTVHNAARIVKIPGTMAGKGDSTEDRPHRRSYFKAIPEHQKELTVETLEKVADIARQAAPKITPARTLPGGNGKGIQAEAWIAEHLPDFTITRRKQESNGRLILILDKCPWNPEHNQGEAVITQEPDGKLGFKCQHTSCSSYGWKELREKFDPKAERQKNAHFTETGDAETPSEPPEWGEPVCFNARIALPVFPVDCLPLCARAYVESVAQSRQVPIDLPAMLTLGVLAGAAARKFRVYVGNTHDVPLNIYVTVGMEPGSRKSDTFQDMTFPLLDEQQRLIIEKAPQIKEIRTRIDLIDRRIKHLKEQAAKASDEIERRRMEQEAIEEEKIKPEPAPYPKLLTGADSTPESIAADLHEQGGKITLIDAEGGELFQILTGRYEGQGRSNIGIVLQAHGDRQAIISRKGKEPMIIDYPALTMVLTVQPSVIRRMAEKTEFKDRGLLGRFFYALPEVAFGTRLYKNLPINAQARKLYSQTVNEILCIDPPEPEEKNDPAPHHALHIEDEALNLWKQFYDQIEKDQAEGEHLAPFRDWASKMASGIARIAGILHVAEHSGGDVPENIGRKMVHKACKIGTYLLEHAKAAYGIMGASPGAARAREIMEWIGRNPKCFEGFTLRDLMRSFHKYESEQGEPDYFDTGFKALESRGIIRVRGARNEHAKGRRPLAAYEVNPSCATCRKCITRVGE